MFMNMLMLMILMSLVGTKLNWSAYCRYIACYAGHILKQIKIAVPFWISLLLLIHLEVLVARIGKE